MGTDLLLQLLADSAAPINEEVASTARVQAITQELVFVEIYSAAEDMTRLGCRYDLWRSVGDFRPPYVSLRCRAAASIITSVVDVLARKKKAPKRLEVLRATPMSPLEVPTACFRKGAKTL